MTQVVVNPGVCGKKVTIETKKVGKRGVRIDITSDCKMVNEMGESLDEVGRWDVFKPLIDSPFYECPLHQSGSSGGYHQPLPGWYPLEQRREFRQPSAHY